MQTFRQAPINRADVPLLEYRGTLVKCAEARSKPLDANGLTVPVLCMDIELECSLHNVMHVEQPYEPNEFALVQARAKALKKGTEVTVQVSPIDIRLVARNAALITPIKPTNKPQEPELWQA